METEVYERMRFDRAVELCEGRLIDVSSIMKQYGLSNEGAISRLVWDKYVASDPKQLSALDIVWMLFCHISEFLPCIREAHPDGEIIRYEVVTWIPGHPEPTQIHLKAFIHEKTGWITIYEEKEPAPGVKS